MSTPEKKDKQQEESTGKRFQDSIDELYGLPPSDAEEEEDDDA